MRKVHKGILFRIIRMPRNSAKVYRGRQLFTMILGVANFPVSSITGAVADATCKTKAVSRIQRSQPAGIHVTLRGVGHLPPFASTECIAYKK